MPTSPLPHYGVLVPAKPPGVAKSRLGALGDRVRAELAAAFAADTVSAALESPRVACVLVVTDDPRLAAEMTDLGAEVLPDGTSDDLNGSLVLAGAELQRRRPELAVAALTADLPALKPDELTRALSEAPHDRSSFVADTERVGTTLLVAPSAERLRPRFGACSREAHLSAGAFEMPLVDVPGLRRDVDEPDDLKAALVLGVGSRTDTVVSARRL